MLKALCIVAAVAVVARAQYYGAPNRPFGASATAGGFNAHASAGSYGFGTGGSIVFPTNNAPHHGLPVFPARPAGNTAYPNNNVGPVRPVNPSGPFNPGRPVNPTGPFNPVGPVNPVRPVNPTGPFNPVGPVNPTGPFNPVGPVGGNLQGGPPRCRPGAQVDHEALGSQYHFSWCHDNHQKYEGQQAFAYCSRLGPGWNAISIESRAEDQLAVQVIQGHNLDYIWTGGVRQGRGFVWPTGAQVSYNNWSRTGLDGLPQPDNREDNNEQCLAILNNFYQDGVTWHDIGCHHVKPVICERSNFSG